MLSHILHTGRHRNLVGPVLGGLLANPVVLYPSVFPPNSIWDAHRYLLPNLVVASLQMLTLLLIFLFLRETHPHMAQRPDGGLSITAMIKGYFRGDPAQRPGVSYAPLPADPGPASPEAPQSTTEVHPLADLEEQAAPETKSAPARAFTAQVVLQILALSLLAFHKVSSDSITGTFLALGSPPSSHKAGARIPNQNLTLTSSSSSSLHTNAGFGLDTRTIGIIFLTEAIFRVAIQPTLIPWFVSKLGALAAFRCVLGLYPALYLATPFLPNLPSPLGLGVLLLDLWIKVALSSVAYICSAVL